MKVAILGGSFDPPHIGHTLIAQQVIEKLRVNQVWFMPNYSTKAHDKIFQKQLSSVKDRLAMAKMLEDQQIKISDFEIIHNPSSITIETLEKLTRIYPQHEFSWITGSDKLKDFHKYDRWQDIIKNYTLIIFPREHTLWHIEERVKEGLRLRTIPEHVIVLSSRDVLLTNVSSSIIRDRVKKGLSIHYLVPEEVEKYIKKHKLYLT